MRLSTTLEFAFTLSAVSLLAACGGGGEHGGGEGGGVNMPVTTGLLQSISITPSASSVAACSAVQFTATGKYSDGTIIDVTNGVFWEIDPANSGVAVADALSGQVTGINAGSAVVNAWTGQGIAASAVLNVTSGNLTGLSVTPASSLLAPAGTQAYTATATCSGGSIDISRMNIWTSSNAAVARISVSGLATAVTAGSTVISATAGATAASAVLNVQ